MTAEARERITFRGRTLNRRTALMVEAAEEELGRPIIVTQGSYNAGGVKASAGTHDGGGAVDLWAPGASGAELQWACRAVGFAAWYRPNTPNVWPDHVHGIAIGDPELSTGARAQVVQFYAGLNGLASRAVDSTPRPTPMPVFDYEEAVQMKLTDKIKDGVTVKDALLAALRTEQSLKTFRENELERDRALKAELRDRLKKLPGQTRTQVEAALGDLLAEKEKQ